MTETNKLRAVFLAALMFLAVFAGTVALAGSASAGHGTTSVSMADQTVVNSTTAEFTVDVTAHNDDTVVISNSTDVIGTRTLTEDVDGEITVEADVTASTSGDTYTADVEDSDGNSLVTAASATVSIAEDPSAVDQGAVEYTNDNGNSYVEVVFAEGDYANLADFQVELEDREGNSVTANVASVGGASNNQVNVSSAANLTGEATLTVMGESHTVETTSTTAEDGGAAEKEPFAGENIAILADSTDETVVIEYPDKTITRGTGEDSYVRTLSDSGDYEAGDWINVTFDAGTGPTVAMQLRDMGLEASTDADSYEQGSEIEVTATADHVERDIEFRLENEDGEQVGDAVSDTSDSNGEASATLTAPSDEAGNYTVVAEDIETGVTAATDVEVVEPADINVGFSSSQYSENEGDVAQFSIDVEGTDQVLVEVGDAEEMGYEAHLVVTPNEDGEIVLNMNTYLAGGWNGATVSEVFEAEEGTITSTSRESSNLNRPLEQGLYDLIVSSQDTQGDWQEEDISALNVEERSTDSLTVYTAPDAGDVSGETEASEIATGDAVLLEVEANGIYGLLETWEDNETAQLAADNALNLEIEQTNEGPNRDPKVVNLTASGAETFVDAENETVWVVIDSGAIQTDRDSYEAGDNYEASFTASENYEYVDAAQEVNDSYTVVERTASLDTDASGNVTVQPAEGQQISGVTSVAPGTELRLRARATGESPFLKTAETEVESDGTFAGEFDFSNIDEGQTFTASVRGGDFGTVEAPGIVQEADPATVNIEDQEAEETGDVVTVRSVYVPDGGFVTIHDDSLLDGATFDSVRGTSDYLSEGQHSNVEVALDEPYDIGDHEVIAMPHQDTNDNQAYDFLDSDGDEDGPYLNQDDEAVTDSATLSVVEEPTPTPTDEPSDDDSTEEPTDTATDTEEPDDQPGFGAVVALVALLGAALLAARRNAF